MYIRMFVINLFNSECMDVDFLLHIICFGFIDNMLKVLQENVS